jgi:hypothetical protein
MVEYSKIADEIPPALQAAAFVALDKDRLKYKRTVDDKTAEIQLVKYEDKDGNHLSSNGKFMDEDMILVEDCFNAIKDLPDETSTEDPLPLKFPSLKLGHVQNALQKRHSGVR